MLDFCFNPRIVMQYISPGLCHLHYDRTLWTAFMVMIMIPVGTSLWMDRQFVSPPCQQGSITAASRSLSHSKAPTCSQTLCFLICFTCTASMTHTSLLSLSLCILALHFSYSLSPFHSACVSVYPLNTAQKALSSVWCLLFRQLLQLWSSYVESFAKLAFHKSDNNMRW